MFSWGADLEEVKQTKDGTMYTFLIADESASILAIFRDEYGAAMVPGDIIHMCSGFVTLFKGHLRIACKLGTLKKIGR